jgi:hypothetical protein
MSAATTFNEDVKEIRELLTERDLPIVNVAALYIASTLLLRDTMVVTTSIEGDAGLVLRVIDACERFRESPEEYLRALAEAARLVLAERGFKIVGVNVEPVADITH